MAPANGEVIVTLLDARAYTLPKAKQEDPHVLAGVAATMLAADGQVPDLVARSAVSHTVHGLPKSLDRGKPDRPWMKRKPRP